MFIDFEGKVLPSRLLGTLEYTVAKVVISIHRFSTSKIQILSQSKVPPHTFRKSLGSQEPEEPVLTLPL